MTSAITETAQYMTFKLGDELFAINVAQVREVLEVSQITRIPTAPDYMRGVVNVRGKAIPVVDLRLKFGLPPGQSTVHTRIVVIELEMDNEVTVVGGVADSVHEVIELEPGQINPPPSIASRASGTSPTGVCATPPSARAGSRLASPTNVATALLAGRS